MLRGLVAGVAEPLHRHRDLRRVEIEDAVAALRSPRRSSRCPRISLSRARVSSASSIVRESSAAPSVAICLRATSSDATIGRFGDVERNILRTALEAVDRDALALVMQHRALRERREHLVRRVDAQIGAGGGRRERQRRMEVKVRSPRLVDEQHLARIVDDSLDRGEVGRDAVVRRRYEIDGGEVGVLFERLRDGLPASRSGPCAGPASTSGGM